MQTYEQLDRSNLFYYFVDINENVNVITLWIHVYIVPQEVKSLTCSTVGSALSITWNPPAGGSAVSYEVSVLQIVHVQGTRMVTSEALSPQFLREIASTTIQSPTLSKFNIRSCRIHDK